MAHKIALKNHRSGVNNNEVSQVLTVLTRTFDHQHPRDGETAKKTRRIDFTKKVVDLLESIGEDPILYYDAFPVDWDFEIKE